MSGRNNHVQAPIVESDLFGRDRAHGVEGDERVGRVLLDERGDVRRGGQDAGGSVDWGLVCVTWLRMCNASVKGRRERKYHG